MKHIFVSTENKYLLPDKETHFLVVSEGTHFLVVLKGKILFVFADNTIKSFLTLIRRTKALHFLHIQCYKF